MDRKVRVWNEEVEVSVEKRSKSVWVAVGNYLGDRVEVTGRSEMAALSAWRKAAEYRGN